MKNTIKNLKVIRKGISDLSGIGIVQSCFMLTEFIVRFKIGRDNI